MPDFLALLGEGAEADEPGQPVAIAPADANTRGRRGKAKAVFFLSNTMSMILTGNS